ncbi:glycoside hydrolase family 65 protein [Nitriliruptoraceae bacterium ZYF776]|nr:glycoside hydrolase family 65 protein [Profundirhabdus halotolerans]
MAGATPSDVVPAHVDVVPAHVDVTPVHLGVGCGEVSPPARVRAPRPPPDAPVVAGLGLALSPDPGWQLVLTGDDPHRQRVEAALGHTADGRFGTRGGAEELPGTDLDAVRALGVYRPGTARTGLDATPTLLPGPAWIGLSLDGVDQRHVLDLRTGMLWRWDGEVWIVRFHALARPGVAVLVAEGPPDRLDARAELWPHPRHRGGAGSVGGTVASVTHGGRAWIGAVATQHTEDVAGRRRLERRVRFTTGTGRVDLARSRDEVAALATVSTAELVAEQRTAWAARWARADVRLDGDDELQHAIRVGIHHLVANAPDVGEAAIGPRGTSGDAYRGHVFWDADVFVLPFLAATHPPAARAVVAYRDARRPAARDAARVAGLAGARFPWESAADGTDVTPTEARGLDGAAVPILTGQLQEHITADVAWSAVHLWEWTGDAALLRDVVRPLLFETARYWRSRVDRDEDGSVHLRGVMGPDEYHAPVDDDAFTNGMVRWNLRRAASLVRAHDPPGLRGEAAAWRRLAARLEDGYDAWSGRHRRFAGIDELEPLQARDVARPPVAVDLVLGRERTAASQLAKQPAVLMLHHLLPEAVPAGSLERDLAHELPLLVHGSSLSPGIAATQLARAGRHREAVELLRLAARLDLDDATGTTAAGVHLAAAGSVWQALVFGFLGAHPGPDRWLRVDPRLPPGWRRLTVPLVFRGVELTVTAEPRRVTVEANGPVWLQLGAHRVRVLAGRTQLPWGRATAGRSGR